MSEGPGVIAIVPARGGSRGIPGKNIKPLNGKPLIAYSIEAALASRHITRVIVSTDDRDIAKVAGEYGAEVVARPAALAQDDSPTVAVLQHVLSHLEEVEGFRPDIVVTLQPTSPLRTVEDIDAAVGQFLEGGRRPVVSVCRSEHPPQWMYTIERGRLRPLLDGGQSLTRRQAAPEVYRLNGAIYVNSPDSLLLGDSLVGDDASGYVMSPERSVDIDTGIDFNVAELLMKGSDAPEGIKIGDKTVGAGRSCFIIAEAGVNHNGDVNLARKLIDAASSSGADAVKFQTFRAERLVSPDAAKVAYQQAATGREETQFEMLKKLELSADDFRELCRYSLEKGLIFLATPFDKDSVDLLNELNVPAFKVGSGEITNHSLLKHLAGKGKPVLLSTGMSALDEVAEAISALREAGLREILLFHCVSEYPAKSEEMNLKAMETLRNAFGLPIGLSDHSVGINVPVAAAALGAAAIEKHFTLDKSLPGPDHRASLEPDEFREMVKAVRDVERAMGDGIKRPTAAEVKNRSLIRRGIVAVTDIPEGAVLTAEMLEAKRPASGIDASHLEKVVGKKVKKRITRGSPLTRDDVRGIEGIL